MKRTILALILAPLVTGCMGLDQRFADARLEWGSAVSDQASAQIVANDKLSAEVQASAAEMAAGLKTAEQHLATVEAASERRSDTIGESLDALGDSVKETWEDLEAGVKADLASVSAGVKGAAGVMGFGPIWDLVAAVGASVMATNAARNRGLPGTSRISSGP